MDYKGASGFADHRPYQSVGFLKTNSIATVMLLVLYSAERLRRQFLVKLERMPGSIGARLPNMKFVNRAFEQEMGRFCP